MRISRTHAPFTLVISSVLYPDKIQMRIKTLLFTLYKRISVGQNTNLITILLGFPRLHVNQGWLCTGQEGGDRAPETVW